MSYSVLQIPEGIRFECTGCGNCCLGWPVPLTRLDAERIGSFELASVSAEPVRNASFVRRLHSEDQRFGEFTHTLEKGSDGRCVFLTDDQRCALHAQHGETAKPSMCRLFPYAFTDTPSGVYAYVSFAATGVLYNSGRLLSEQRELLLSRLELYRSLFPSVNRDWSRLQLLDGHELSWDAYLDLERQFQEIVLDQSAGTILERLARCCEIAVCALPDGAAIDIQLPLRCGPEIVDLLLMRDLNSLYFPSDVFGKTTLDLDARKLLMDGDKPEPDSLLRHEFSQLSDLSVDDLLPLAEHQKIDELLQRFVYTRIFAKLYFGPSYGHFSLIAGLHHLYLLLAILHLRLKRAAVSKAVPLNFELVAEDVRTLERRLSQMNLSPQSCAVLEVLLSSPSRVRRVSAFVR